MPPKDKTSSIIIKKINALADKVKDIENAIVETIVDSINMPRPKDGEPGKDGVGKPGKPGEPGKPGKLGKPGKKGDKGDPGVSLKGDRGDKGGNGLPGIDGADGADGNDAKRLQLRSDGHIVQWKSEDEEVWKNLFIVPQPRGGGGGGGALSSGQVAKSKQQVINEITFADSPFTMLHDQDRIYVDATDGDVIVNLLGLSTVITKPIHVQKTDASINIVMVTAKGSDVINGIPTKEISSIDVDHEFVPISNEWRLS